MKKIVQAKSSSASERRALRHRVTNLYARFNEADWPGCFAYIDPQLTERGKVDATTHSAQMQAFKAA
ncbi:MAG: hypothetical protein U0793_23220 [Gemmataceae bacterium]